MNSAEVKEELDYQEDVTNLKRVWAQIKEPNKKKVKDTQNKTMAATQTKHQNENKPKGSKEKKPKVVVSEANMKETVRNPKFKPATVIEVVTQPEKKHSDPIRN